MVSVESEPEAAGLALRAGLPRDVRSCGALCWAAVGLRPRDFIPDRGRVQKIQA